MRADEAQHQAAGEGQPPLPKFGQQRLGHRGVVQRTKPILQRASRRMNRLVALPAYSGAKISAA